MPALVARDLVAWIAARGGRLIAGSVAPGLDRAVGGVWRLRRIIARELEAINPHDVILVSIDTFIANTDRPLPVLLTTLAETQSALIVVGLDPLIHDVAALATLADRVALPLLAMPAQTDLNELLLSIDGFIQQREIASARFLRDGVAACARAARPDQTATAALQALADFTGLFVILEDERRVSLMTAAPPEPPCALDVAQNALASLAARQSVRPATPAGAARDIPVQRHLPGQLARAIVPMRQQDVIVGYLALLGPVDRVTSSHVDLLWRVTPLCLPAIAGLRHHHVDWRLAAAEDLRTILAASLPEGEALRRAHNHGIELANDNVVILALPLEDRQDSWPEEQFDRIMRLTPPLWSAPLDDGVATVVSAGDMLEERIARLWAVFVDDAVPVVIGVGQVAHGVDGIPRSLAEARTAARACRLGGAGIMWYGRLGILRLLHPLAQDGSLERYARETLDPLLRADAYHGESLIETLAAWFDAHGNLTEAARRLNIHRNTLMYRLRRTGEVLGYRLDDPVLRLELQVAIQIWRILRK